MQGAAYGLLVFGVRSLRILFGPLPFAICNIETWGVNVTIWYIVLTMFFISLFKFMYICVWKSMRDLNDNLVVRIVINISIFISVWVPATGFVNRKGSSVENFCTGTFNDHDQLLDPQIPPEKLPLPYAPIFWTLLILTLFFTIFVMIERHKMSLQENNYSRQLIFYLMLKL